MLGLMSSARTLAFVSCFALAAACWVAFSDESKRESHWTASPTNDADPEFDRIIECVSKVHDTDKVLADAFAYCEGTELERRSVGGCFHYAGQIASMAWAKAFKECQLKVSTK